MKIKRISLYNIGPYIGFNSFDIEVDKNKNIILIGGKNGAGKTTFFKSIKTCLYGCKVWGFDAPCKEYYSIINGLVNSKSMYASSSVAYIEVELYFNDGKQTNTYTLHREWKKSKMTFCEFFNIKKNGELIVGNEEDDFINYLLSIIPPDMFNFYFFDGESIADFFLGSDGNKNFRNAFLKLYGLDTLSLMVDNFNRNIKKSSIQESSYLTYLQAKHNHEKLELSFNNLGEELKNLESEIDSTQMQIEALQFSYKKDGGVSVSEWKRLNAEMLKEENERDNINRWLKEIANHYLPFVILKKEMDALLNNLNDSQQSLRKEIIFDAIISDEFKSDLSEFINYKKALNITADDIAEFIAKSFSVEQNYLNYDLSINQQDKVIAQIYEKKDFSEKTINDVVSRLNNSLNKSRQIREILASSNIDNYERFIAKKEELEHHLFDLRVRIEKKTKDKENKKQELSISLKELITSKIAYENVLKSKSISNISERAAATFSLVEEKLVARQAKLLQNEFIKCFNSIINKSNFIDGIVIDKKINVIPYKYIQLKREQLENYRARNQEFLSLFNDAKLIIDMNKLDFSEVDSINVPSPITAPFSQGERQVYIMSLYLALLKTSHKDIPFFIDTPFARIDSDHRENIVNEFFIKVSNQMFVLSTDEEIVGHYKNMLNKRLANTFKLSISDYGSTKILSDTYFGE